MQEEKEDNIVHFSHPRPLKLETSAPYQFPECKICLQDVKDEFYKCFDCSYYLHPLCAKFPEKMILPFHPHHTLSFREIPDGIYESCHVCRGNPLNGFAYFCMLCNFALHLKCSLLTPVDKLAEQKFPDASHQHSLLVCENPQNVFEYNCDICKEGFCSFDHIYACRECSCLMHKICARLQNEIRHPFHLEHPLTLTLTDFLHKKAKCDACGKNYIRSGKYMYQCRICYFTLDVHCAATFLPISEIKLSKQVHLVQYLSEMEPHAILECASIKNFRRRCFGCDQSFEESSIHVCLECSILLDRKCIDLPRDISHPFHPQHSLILAKGYSWPCIGCRNNIENFCYICKECRFFLDLKCPRMKLELIPSRIHKHDLAYFYFEVEGEWCSICREWCDKFIFRCVQCNFHVHDHCYPELPQTIKHECHSDPLTLSLAPIKDYHSGQDEKGAEFYCFACEDFRQFSHPTYYCAECHYAAHVHCVISEIIRYLRVLFKTSPRLEGFKKEAKAAITYFGSPASTSSDNDSEHDLKAPHAAEDDSHKIADPSVYYEQDAMMLLLQGEVNEMAAEISQVEAEMRRLATMLNELKGRRSESHAILQHMLIERN